MLFLENEAMFGNYMAIYLAFAMLFIVTIFGFFIYNYTQIKIQNTIMSVKDEFKSIIVTVKEDILKSGHEHNIAIIELANSIKNAIEETTQAKMEFKAFINEHKIEHLSEYSRIKSGMKECLDGVKLQGKDIRDLYYKAKTLDERLRDLASNGNTQYVEKKHFDSIFTEFFIKKDEYED